MKLLTAFLALAMLAACGRVGPPRPPGPPEQVTFPRSYPAPDRVPPSVPPVGASPALTAPAR